MKRRWPAPERNRGPILEVLERLVPDGAHVLEIAGGTGQHAVHFAAGLPMVTWTPTDADPGSLASIRAWRDEAQLPNLREPLTLDVSLQPWPLTSADVVVCINMIHITPWSCTQALLQGSDAVLPAGGLLVLYGPFMRAGRHTAPSNAAFDRSLKARDPRWGVRDLDGVTGVAARCHLSLEEVVPMPANNLTLILRKTAD